MDDTLAEALATDKRVDYLTFIGSAEVGWHLRSKLAPGTRCALEHGGAAPVIVERDADIADTLPLLAKGGFYHAGQVCVSVQRVFAQSSVVKKVAEGLKELALEAKVGDPMNEDTQIGPLINPWGGFEGSYLGKRGSEERREASLRGQKNRKNLLRTHGGP